MELDVEQVFNHPPHQKQDPFTSYWGLEFVRGLEGHSDTAPIAWVRGGGYPPYQEVITRIPIFGATTLVALLDHIDGQSTLCFGLIVPDDRRPRYLGKQSGERPRLTGKLWAWNSKSGQIYTKPFDSKNTFSGINDIARHDCSITTASDLSVYRDLKNKTVHFIINGKDIEVSCGGNGPDFCYGYLRMVCQNDDSRIRVTLVPEIKDEGFSKLFPVTNDKTKSFQDNKSLTETPDLSFYGMNSHPVGLCLMINNGPNLLKPEKQLADLFTSLAIKVQVKQGLKMLQIYEEAGKFAENVPDGYDWFVCILISPGGQDHEITGVDGRKASVEQVMSEFKASNCPSLRNKPKLFFVLRFTMSPTAGLVEGHDSSMQARYYTDKTEPSSSHRAEHEIDACPEEADFLFISATSSIHEGQQSPEHLFIKVFKKVVIKYKDVYHLLEMLTKVNEWMLDMSPTPETLRGEASNVPDAPLSQLNRYELNKRPRGYCVIINNFKFQEKNVPDRYGALEDEKSLKTLFDALQFKVIIRKDLDKHEIEKVAEEYGSKTHHKFNAFFLIVMSHGGDRDCILGVDGRKTNVRNLMVKFQVNKCPSLKGKPKVFFIQTCRGLIDHSSFETLPSPFASTNSPPAAFKLSPADSQSCTRPFSPDSNLSRSVYPLEADFLLAFATEPGYVAFRSLESGTFFIQALVEVIRDYHDRHHLLDILTEVTRQVVDQQNREPNMGNPVQVPAPTHTLTKHLYLERND